MFNVCGGCGLYDVDKQVDAAASVAICRHCGYRQRFRRLPLFVLTGASGSGKSTLCRVLPDALPECVVLENDILWRPEFAQPEDGYRSYRELCLRLAKNIAQSGRPVLLCGSAIPEQFEQCVERRYFAAVHYLALVCDGGLLTARLRARPDWRGSAAADVLARMERFNAWLREHATYTRPPMTLLDTTNVPVRETLEGVTAWVRHRLVRSDTPASSGDPRL